MQENSIEELLNDDEGVDESENETTQTTEDDVDESETTQETTTKSQEIDQTNTNQSQQPQQTTNLGQDLIGPDGKVVAKAGAERRFYEEAQRLRREHQHFTQNVLPEIKSQYRAMESELNSYKTMMNNFKANDLSAQDLQTGIDFVKEWKKNPQNVVKFLLTTLQSNGINVDIEGMQSSINAESISQMMDRKLRPFIEEREQRVEQQQLNDKAVSDYQSFIQQYPDSIVHDKTLAYMIRQNPSLTPEVAYYKLKNYYLQKGLDFNKSLEEIAQTPNNGAQGLPKTPNVSANVVQNINQHDKFGANDTYQSIIRRTMVDAGIK